MFAPDAWHDDALCREHPEVDMFPHTAGAAIRAKALCTGCLVRDVCLAFALDAGITEGVYGATSGKERAAMLRAQRHQHAA